MIHTISDIIKTSFKPIPTATTQDAVRILLARMMVLLSMGIIAVVIMLIAVLIAVLIP